MPVNTYNPSVTMQTQILQQCALCSLTRGQQVCCMTLNEVHSLTAVSLGPVREAAMPLATDMYGMKPL